ncbi:MAG: STN domain-containing protein, partial [Bacteroidota bacterium]
MKSYRCCVPFRARNSLIKYLLMTKIAILLLFAFSTQSFARSYGQKNINLRLENVELKKAFKAIENQGFFHFVYQEGILPRDQRVSIQVQDASLDAVLGILLAKTSLRYRQLSDNLVVITPDRPTDV